MNKQPVTLEQAVIMLRVMINDIVSPYEIQDKVLRDLIVTSFFMVLQEANFITGNYTYSLNPPSISPDMEPLVAMLVVLKAACMLLQRQILTSAKLSGLAARMGPATMQISSGGQSPLFQLLIDNGPCSLYNELILKWNVMNPDLIHAFMTPFVSYSMNGTEGGNSPYDMFQ